MKINSALAKIILNKMTKLGNLTLSDIKPYLTIKPVINCVVFTKALKEKNSINRQI